MIDTHSHLLPGLDDGAATMDESLAMAREAARQGVREILCTPHLVEPNLNALDRGAISIEMLREALAAEGIDLVLHLGFEIDFYTALSAAPAELAPFASGATGRVLIIEMPYEGWLPRTGEALFRLRLAGFTLVLAHPERSERVQRHPEVLEELLRQGAVAQGTVPSLMGDFGTSARRTLLRLLSSGRLSLLATDAHHSRPAAWGFEPAFNELAHLAPDADRDLIVQRNPHSLLNGDALAQAQPSRIKAGIRGLLDRISGNLV